jgi:hypothetical protein
MQYKTIILFVITGMFGLQFGHGQTYEKSRQEVKSFKAFKQTSLEIYNKYGNIHLFPWAKDSVKIEINLEVKANKQSKVDKIFDYISFDFSDSRYYIIARTELRPNQNSFWSEVSDVTNSVFGGNTKTSIDYHIYLPASMNIKIENKFGNIYCTDHIGKFDVKLANGDFKANNLSGESTLHLSFGNAGVNFMEEGTLNLNYCEFDLSKAKIIQIKSKSSTIHIDEIESLKMESKRDKYFINKLGTLAGESSFSYLTIKGFSRNLKMQTEYGELKLTGIEFGYNLIDLNTKYTDIYLNINKDFHGALEISHSGGAYLDYPENISELNTETIDEKNEVYKTTAFVGERTKPFGKVNITIRSGKMSIQEGIQSF